MQTFPPPSSRLKFSRLSKEAMHHSENIFDSFPIHSIHLLIPSRSASSEKYEDMLVSDENTYFIAKDIVASSLIQNEFLVHFVKACLLLALSENAKVEVENFLSIIPPGKLVLTLEKSIAESLALHKENPCKKKKRRKLFQTIIIDLTCPEFFPGKKVYEFVSSELSKIDCIKFTLLLKWKPYGNACCQSLRKYFISKGYECIACKPNYKSSFKRSVLAPNINFDMHDLNACENILEWIGVQICGIEYSSFDDEYISKFSPPESSKILNMLQKCSFEGFYCKVEVLSVIKEMSKMFETDSTLPFIAVCLSGFQDSYLVANGYQHFSSADKLICIIIFPLYNYWFITLNVR